MNPVHSKKLLLSKWTAVQPQQREKHFLVTALVEPEPPGAALEWVELEAVHSRRSQRIRWRELRDAQQWRRGLGVSPVFDGMQALPAGYRALVLGASGGLGAALLAHLQADPRCGQALGLHRQSQPPLDLSDEASVAAAAASLASAAPFQLIVNATGLLHGPGLMPEKKLGDLRLAALQQVFAVNTFGPALLLRELVPLLDRQCGRMALLSAKVGSIGDNRLGGWYSYRASKAALNMLVKTAAIELRRTHPGAVLLALHPGTVSSRLSAPFRGGEIGRSAELAARELLGVVDRLRVEDSGGFFSYAGEALPW